MVDSHGYHDSFRSQTYDALLRFLDHSTIGKLCDTCNGSSAKRSSCPGTGPFENLTEADLHHHCARRPKEFSCTMTYACSPFSRQPIFTFLLAGQIVHVLVGTDRQGHRANRTLPVKSAQSWRLYQCGASISEHAGLMDCVGDHHHTRAAANRASRPNPVVSIGQTRPLTADRGVGDSGNSAAGGMEFAARNGALSVQLV